MFQKCQQHAHLRFLTEYEITLTKLRSDFGSIVNKYNNVTDTLISSAGFNALFDVVAPAARHLSNKRLKFDIDALNKFGFIVQENTGWLKENQHNLLLENFWKQFVLTEYQKPVFRGRGSLGENKVLNELRNILHQVEREINVLELEPIMVQLQPVPNISNNFYGETLNINQGSGTFNVNQTINNGVELQEVFANFIELLGKSEIPESFKKDTMILAETFAEEAKTGQVNESTRKSLIEKLLVIKEPATTINAVIGVTSALYNATNYIYNLVFK